MPRYSRQFGDGGVAPTIVAPDLTAATNLLDAASKGLAKRGVESEAEKARMEGRAPQFSTAMKGLAPEAVKEATDNAHNYALNSAVLELETISNAAHFPDGTTIDEANQIKQNGLDLLKKMEEFQGLSPEGHQRLLIQIERERGRISRDAGINARREVNKAANDKRDTSILLQNQQVRRQAMDDPGTLIDSVNAFRAMLDSEDEEQRAFGEAGIRSVVAYSPAALQNAAELALKQGYSVGDARKDAMALGEGLGMADADVETAVKDALAAQAARDGLDLTVLPDLSSDARQAIIAGKAKARAMELGLEEGRETNDFVNRFTAAATSAGMGNKALTLARSAIYGKFAEMKDNYLNEKRRQAGDPTLQLMESDLDDLQILWSEQEQTLSATYLLGLVDDPKAEFARIISTQSTAFGQQVKRPPTAAEEGNALVRGFDERSKKRRKQQ